MIIALKPYQKKIINDLERNRNYAKANERYLEFAKYNNAHRVRISEANGHKNIVSELGTALQNIIHEFQQRFPER